jgi:hypothetical protein
MDTMLSTNRAATHRFTVPCFTRMHHGLLGTIWRRKPTIRLPFLSTRGNSGATIADEFSITLETWLSSQPDKRFTRTLSTTLSQYETAALTSKHFNIPKYFRSTVIPACLMHLSDVSW